MYATQNQIADRLTSWENFLNGMDDGPATEQDTGDHWDLDVISRDAYLTGNAALIAKVEHVQELFDVVVLRENNQLHDVLMSDDDLSTPYTPPAHAAGYVPSITIEELDAAFAARNLKPL